MTTRPIKPGPLKTAFKTDLAACWKLSRTLHPDHAPYAFMLYGLEGGAYFMPQVLTDEGLAQVASRHLKEGFHDTLEEACKALRYSVADSPLFAELEDKLVTVTELLKPHGKYLTDEETAAYELLAKAAMAAFAELDAEGLFGKGRQREQLMLAIMTEDTEKEWAQPSIKRLNPETVFKRFEADTRIEGAWAASQAIALSPDKSSLYSTGSRDLKVKKLKARQDKDTAEIVAYDLAGMQLKRRWEFSFPMFGDSGRAIACASDGKTIFVMRAKYMGQVGHTILMRFDRDRNTVVEQVQIKGEPAGMAVAANDARIAVVMLDQTLHVLDGKFSVLKVIPLPARSHNLIFLRSGNLLLATAAGILQMNQEFKLTATSFKENCVQISLNDLENLLAVCPEFRGPFNAKLAGEQIPAGYKLLRLPSFDLAGEFKLPRLGVEMAAISPDGRHVALHTKQINAYKNFIVICETATGREIARRKAGRINELKFLPDNRTLAIAESKFTTTEPVTFWRVPGL